VGIYEGSSIIIFDAIFILPYKKNTKKEVEKDVLEAIKTVRAK
jgi:hypothetical protein